MLDIIIMYNRLLTDSWIMFNVFVADSLCDCSIKFVILPLMSDTIEDPVVVFSSKIAEPNNRIKNEKKCTPAF